MRGAVLSRVAGNLQRLLAELVEVEVVNLLANLGLQPLALLDDRGTQAIDAWRRHVPGAIQLVEDQQGNVELPHGSERARETPDRPAYLPRFCAGGDERNGGPEPARGNARAV